MRLEGSLIDQYVQVHRRKRWRGNTIKRYIDQIAEICAEIETHSILDYGCGKGKQYTEDRIHESWDIHGDTVPTLFDPGVSGIDELPTGKFDGVICTGVLEHIPEDEIDQAIANLARYARKWCFIVVGIGPTKKLLPDGRQAHVTLQPPKWWKQKVSEGFGDSGVKVSLLFES